jgi:hypothetical protein
LELDDCEPDACELDDAGFEADEADAEAELEMAEEVGFELSVGSVDGGLLLAGGGLSEEGAGGAGSFVLREATVVGGLLVGAGAGSLAFDGVGSEAGGTGSIVLGGATVVGGMVGAGAGSLAFGGLGRHSLGEGRGRLCRLCPLALDNSFCTRVVALHCREQRPKVENGLDVVRILTIATRTGADLRKEIPSILSVVIHCFRCLHGSFHPGSHLINTWNDRCTKLCD